MTTEQITVDNSTDPPPDRRQHNGWRTFGIIVITMAVTLAVGYWAVTTWLFPTEFKPVVLNQAQQQTLDRKIKILGGNSQSIEKTASEKEAIEPEAYSEVGASREVEFSERELNALLAKNTELANKLAIDLSDNLVSAKLLVDVDPDFPILGGKTIKVTGGMELRLVDSKPSAVLKGISVWGVPLPNAWIGNIKNVDLMQEFGETGGFWQALNEGVEKIEVRDGRLLVKLKE
jgi:hypothetical protein